jgi:transposase
MRNKNSKSILDHAKKLINNPDPILRSNVINGLNAHRWPHPEDVLPLLYEVQSDFDRKVCNAIVKVLGQVSCRKGCLKKVVDSLDNWDNKEIVKEAKCEIYKKYIDSDAFDDNSNDSNLFKSLLVLKTIDKKGVNKRRMRKYYRDLYKINNVIPRGLLYDEGRKVSGRRTILSKEAENRFIHMIQNSSRGFFFNSAIYLPKNQRKIVYFHRRLEEEFGKIPRRLLDYLVLKHGLNKYLEKSDDGDSKVKERFVEMVLQSSVDSTIQRGFIPKKHRTIGSFHRRLESEFGKISKVALYSIIRKYGLKNYIKGLEDEDEQVVNTEKPTPIIVINLKNSDRDVLEKWRNSNDKRKWERSVVFLEYSKLSLKQISLKIERSIRAIKRWIDDYNQYGLAGIQPKKKRDRTKTHEKNNVITNRIIEILHHNPRDYDINRSNWCQPSIAIVYEKKYGEEIPVYKVSQLIKKSGYKWNRARNVLHSPDPDYREKVEILLNVLQSLQPNEMFFFVDELGPQQVKKYGGRSYTKKGEYKKVPQNQNSKGSIILSAALSATTNQLSWIYGNSKDTSSMIDLIEILFNQYYNKSKLYITWDAASWHSSNELIEWLDFVNAQTKKNDDGPLVEFVPLPNNAQFLNIIESVFSGMKRAVIHHSNYQSEEEMKLAISRHFHERNDHFLTNPRRAGKKIWEIDFFNDYDNIKSGNYREW